MNIWSGLGGQVLQRLIHEADAAELAIHLGVLKQSPVARFYTRHGFVKSHEGEWDIYYSRPVGGP